MSRCAKEIKPGPKFDLHLLARRAGVSGNLLCQEFSVNAGRLVGVKKADELAIALGFHPIEIWGDQWFEGIELDDEREAA